jgi:recombination protein RecA
VNRFALDELISSIEKEFGEGTLRPASLLKPRQYRGTGSIALDIATGGGWARSSIVDVIGKQSAGKTLLFEMAAVRAQQIENLPSALFDFEGTFEPKRFAALGGDLDGLLLIRAENFRSDVGPMFIEWSADMLKAQLRSHQLACIGMDSTAAMVSKAEYDIKETKGEEQTTVAYTGRAMASLLRQVCGTGVLARSDCTVFFMSQMRDNIGGRGFKGMPPADKRTGGRALPFFASLQIEVSRGDTFTADVQNDAGFIEKDSEVGHETRIRIRKNKNNAKQGRVCSFDVYSEGDVVGIDRVGELAKLAIVTGVVQKSGTWLTFGDLKVQGAKQLKESLLQDTELYAQVEVRTRTALDAQLQATALPEELVVGSEEDDDFREIAAVEIMQGTQNADQ